MCSVMIEPRLVHIQGRKYPISVISEEQQMMISQQIDARTQQLRAKWGEFNEAITIKKPELTKCKNERLEYHRKWTSAFTNSFKCPTFIKKIFRNFNK